MLHNQCEIQRIYALVKFEKIYVFVLRTEKPITIFLLSIKAENSLK